jgi:hypothetical protein
MKRLKQALFMVIALIVMCGPLAAQRSEKGPKPGPDAVYGRAFNIPAVRAHLTDSETGLPFAEREIGFKYCWGWEVLKRTPETDRISNLMCTERKGKTDKNGIAVLPTWLFTPWRPPAPAGAEYSEPRFRFAGITVDDETHNTYLSVFDADVDLLDRNGEVRRVVRPYHRPVKPKE